eukprot:482632_1
MYASNRTLQPTHIPFISPFIYTTIASAIQPTILTETSTESPSNTTATISFIHPTLNQLIPSLYQTISPTHHLSNSPTFQAVHPSISPSQTPTL